MPHALVSFARRPQTTRHINMSAYSELGGGAGDTVTTLCSSLVCAMYDSTIFTITWALTLCRAGVPSATDVESRKCHQSKRRAILAPKICHMPFALQLQLCDSMIMCHIIIVNLVCWCASARGPFSMRHTFHTHCVVVFT